MIILKLTRKRLALLEAPECVFTWYNKTKADKGEKDKGLRIVLDDNAHVMLRCGQPDVASWLYRRGLLPLLVIEGQQIVGPAKGAFLDGCRLVRCRLMGMNFSGASLRGAFFSECDMKGANFSRARMHRVEMYECDVKGADFTAAQLVDADLPYLKRKQVKDANLRGVAWSNPKVPEGWKFKYGHLELDTKADANRPRRRSRRRFRR